MTNFEKYWAGSIGASVKAKAKAAKEEEILEAVIAINKKLAEENKEFGKKLIAKLVAWPGADVIPLTLALASVSPLKLL